MHELKSLLLFWRHQPKLDMRVSTQGGVGVVETGFVLVAIGGYHTIEAIPPQPKVLLHLFLVGFLFADAFLCAAGPQSLAKVPCLLVCLSPTCLFPFFSRPRSRKLWFLIYASRPFIRCRPSTHAHLISDSVEPIPR